MIVWGLWCFVICLLSVYGFKVYMENHQPRILGLEISAAVQAYVGAVGVFAGRWGLLQALSFARVRTVGLLSESTL